MIGSDYDAYLRYQAATSASIAQTGDILSALHNLLLLALWILDSGASDHISGNKHFFSSITTTSALPTVTLANGSQTMAKGPEYGEDDWHRRESQGIYHLTSPSSPAACISTDAPLLIHSRLGHPSLSKFQKMVPHFSTLLSLACESCQLGKHTRISFPKRLNNRAKSPFELVHTDVWGPCRTAPTLGFQYFVTFIDDYSRLLPLPYISPPLDAFSHLLQVYHRRHCVVAPPLSQLIRQWLMKWLLCTPMAHEILFIYLLVDRLKARLVAKGYTQILCYCVIASLSVDIKNVFLHGELLEEVYMEQPPGFVAQEEQQLGGIQRLKHHFFNHFQTKDLGKLKYFLGLEIAQSSSGEPLRDPGRYRRLVGKLNYLTITRPDISFSCQSMLYEDRDHTQLLVTQMQTGLVHPQIGVPPQGTVFLLEELRFGKDETDKASL
ncbi:hypothetical protein CK203_030011 [Vitis vinifera]|uniref:Uncharacterized protein n=1 Tax=Vitis vinifera TaxID=29760 RepID=A0A438IKF0_VITVI|nr:hypothetical protein CK203_030011 [Vitis vinifera]